MNAQKQVSEKIVMLTCYDFSFAKVLTASESVDYLLVGDSMEMVLYGKSSTVGLSTETMAQHIAAVRLGIDSARAVSKKPLLVGDMVAGSYDSVEDCLKNAQILVDAGADIVKLEGPAIEQVKALRNKGFRVNAHIGLTPQTIQDFKVQGRGKEEANRLLQEAEALDEAGAELLVLEMIPASLAKEITDKVSAKTIGIGAGENCDGQVLVLYDMLGLNPDFKPRFLKTFSDGSEVVKSAVKRYACEVKAHQYPSSEHSF